MKDMNYYIQKIDSMDLNHEYSFNEKEIVAKYFYNLFDELSKMRIIENNKARELSEVEKFLFMYLNIAGKVKDHDENHTSHHIIGTVLTNMSVCQGYSTTMQFICDELSIPFLYKNTDNMYGAHGNFQVILKDNYGIIHCLHCDPYIDAPDNENDTITFNATLIPTSDMNNFYNQQQPTSEFLFWNIAIDNMGVEEKKQQLERLESIDCILDKSLEEATNEHYSSFKKRILELNTFFNCELGNLETHQDILKAYQNMKNYYDKINVPIDRDNLYDMVRKIYISYNIIILNMNNVDAIKNAEEIVNKIIENTNKKHKENWIK